MSRSRMFLASLLVVGLAAAGCAPAALEDEVVALNEKVAALEKQVQTLQRSGGGNSAANAQEAKNALTAVNQLVAAGQVDKAKAKIQQYGNRFAGTREGQQLASLGRELAVVGKKCPSDWGIEKWFQGKEAIDLNSDAPTVVVFWETWCPHCRNEVPKLQKMYEKFRGDGLQLIGVTRINKSATEQAVKDIIAQNNVSYPIAKENGSLASYFAVGGIPAAAVVKDGEVVWRGHPARISDSMIKNWLSS